MTRLRLQTSHSPIREHFWNFSLTDGAQRKGRGRLKLQVQWLTCNELLFVL